MNKETLLLPIKQKHFNEILAGTKKEEYREIKDTTFGKYLDTWKEDGDTGIYYDDELIDYDPEGEIFIYNNGVYPFIPKEYKYLTLAVGYAKDRPTLTVEVKGISFEPLKTKDGKDARFDAAGDELIPNENGNFCIWQVVYELGDILQRP